MDANWRNRTLFHGDNLKFLRAMNSESVDLIHSLFWSGLLQSFSQLSFQRLRFLP